MKFTIEKMDLTGVKSALDWNASPAPRQLCEADGADAGAVLTAVVAKDGGVQLGVAASFADGQAVTIALEGDTVYALRAIPRIELR
ncbi:MAG TPA: hypothetical protein VEK79_11160 [Thermoanaerobaculia bacterium]|nr:hypothetical protein [Thermoanaerobaculia bacterium]